MARSFTPHQSTNAKNSIYGLRRPLKRNAPVTS